MIPQRMTFERATKLRAQLHEAIAIQHANHKGAEYLERDLKAVTTWLVAYANRQDRKTQRQAA